MKKIWMLLLVCFCGYGAMAELPINFGIHGGISSNRIKLRDLKNVRETKDNTGFMLGGFMRLNFGKGYLEPSLNYSHKKSIATKKNNENGPSRDLNLIMNTLDIPIMLGVKILDLSALQLRAYTGPMLSLGNVKNIKKLADQNEDPDKASWKFKVGVGVDVWKLTFDIDYEKAFKKLSHELKAPRSFNFTVGLKII